MWMVRWGPKNKETAKRILRDGKDLTEEDIRYLRHVIEEGTRCEEWLREYERERRDRRLDKPKENR